jgi:hypothetical protein
LKRFRRAETIACESEKCLIKKEILLCGTAKENKFAFGSLGASKQISSSFFAKIRKATSE